MESPSQDLDKKETVADNPEPAAAEEPAPAEDEPMTLARFNKKIINSKLPLRSEEIKKSGAKKEEIKRSEILKDAKKEKLRHEKYEQVKKEITDGDEMLKSLKNPQVECPKHKKAMKFIKPVEGECDYDMCSWCSKNITNAYFGYDQLFSFKCQEIEKVKREGQYG